MYSPIIFLVCSYFAISDQKEIKNVQDFEKYFFTFSLLKKMECVFFWPEGDAVSLGKSTGKATLVRNSCVRIQCTPNYALCVGKFSSTLWKTEFCLSRTQLSLLNLPLCHGSAHSK